MAIIEKTFISTALNSIRFLTKNMNTEGLKVRSVVVYYKINVYIMGI